MWQKSNDKTISKDIKALSKQYHAVVSMPEGKVSPYFVLSRKYAKITGKPKLGFLRGASVGEAKQYFYTKWLPKSSFEALNLEYEYHSERSTKKQPTIDLIVAIRRKTIK